MSGRGRFADVFEIKRPSKSGNSLKKMASNLQLNEDNVEDKERTFQRNSSYRSSARRSKYKKKDNKVKKIAQEFEEGVKHTADSDNNEVDNELYKKLTSRVKTIKNIYEKKSDGSKQEKVQRRKLIRSFVEAETDQEKEEYRKSLVQELDEELARMKQDGFLDENESFKEDLDPNLNTESHSERTNSKCRSLRIKINSDANNEVLSNGTSPVSQKYGFKSSPHPVLNSASPVDSNRDPFKFKSSPESPSSLQSPSGSIKSFLYGSSSGYSVNSRLTEIELNSRSNSFRLKRSTSSASEYSNVESFSNNSHYLKSFESTEISRSNSFKFDRSISLVSDSFTSDSPDSISTSKFIPLRFKLLSDSTSESYNVESPPDSATNFSVFSPNNVDRPKKTNSWLWKYKQQVENVEPDNKQETSNQLVRSRSTGKPPIPQPRYSRNFTDINNDTANEHSSEVLGDLKTTSSNAEENLESTTETDSKRPDLEISDNYECPSDTAKDSPDSGSVLWKWKQKLDRNTNRSLKLRSKDFKRNVSEEFSESLGEDLENGSYVVEAYNDDGRELVIAQISLDRKVINLDSRRSIEESIKTSELVFYETEVSDTTELDNLYEEVGASKPESDFSEVFFDAESKRTTMYTCSSSSSIDEDMVYNSVRRETFVDDQGVVRIERVGFPEEFKTLNEGQPESGLSRNDSVASIKKLSFIVDELKNTERKYVEDLTKVVKKYIPFIMRNSPETLTGCGEKIFGNIAKIYKKQKKFLDALERCGEDVNEVAACFLDYEFLFDLYPNYLKNKPRSDILIKEFSPVIRNMQEKFAEKLDFSAYLLTPLQRLGKYILFLEKIQKEMEKLQIPHVTIQMALGIVRNAMTRGNDCVAIESIENSPISKLDYGSFIMREKFTILKPKRMECVVFLFSDIVVFTFSEQKSMELFNYCDSIKMNDLRIASFEDGTIHLTNFTKSKQKHNASRYTYVLETKSAKVRETWREAIEKLLWQQLFKAKEHSLKMSESEGKKLKPARRRLKSSGSAVFYVD